MSKADDYGTVQSDVAPVATHGEDGEAEEPERVQTVGEIFKEEIVQLKWRVLVFGCFLTYGSYYIYDFPGAIGMGRYNSIESKFVAHGLKYNEVMNQSLYSVYSWPNTVLAFFGGILIDNILGLRKAMVLFCLLVLSGSIVFYIGVLYLQYPVMLLGRVLFGLGGESLSVAQSAFVARWFKGGRGMALAFGITISFARVGSSFNFLFSPKIAASDGIDTSVLFGVFGCIFSLLSALLLVYFDIVGVKRGVVPPESKDTNPPFNIRDVAKLSPKFWLTCGICVTVYCSIFPLIGIAENYFEVKYNITSGKASTYVSLYQFTCAGGSPIVGFLVDQVGRFTFGMIGSGIMFTTIHVLLAATMAPAIFLMMFMGVVYSVLVSSLWPAVPYTCRAGEVGLAYGIMTAMQNTGLAIWPLMVGAILDPYTPAAPPPPPHFSRCDNYTNLQKPMEQNLSWTWPNGTLAYPPNSLTNCSNTTAAPLPDHQGFIYTELLFIGTAGFGVLLGVILLAVDKKGTGLLSAAPGPRAALEKERLAKYAEEDRERGLLVGADEGESAASPLV